MREEGLKEENEIFYLWDITRERESSAKLT